MVLIQLYLTFEISFIEVCRSVLLGNFSSRQKTHFHQ